MNRYVPMLLLLAAVWGASYLFIKVAVEDIEPAPMMAVRTLLAAAVLIAYLVWRLGAARARADLRAAWRHCLALGLRRHRRRHGQRDAGAARHLAVGVQHRRAVDGHLPVADQRLEAASRQVALKPCQHPVQPFRCQTILECPFLWGRVVHRILISKRPLAFFGKRA